MPEQFPHELLAQRVAARLAVDPERLTSDPIPTGKHNTSSYVCGAGEDLVLRLSPPDGSGFLFYERRRMAQEPQLHCSLQAQTEVPVAKLLDFDPSRARSISAQVRARFPLLYEVQKYIVIRIRRQRDPDAALRYKRDARALARPLLESLV